MKKLLSLVALSTLGLGLAGCGEEPVPDYPSYAIHVQPILVARCVRCHSAAGMVGDDSDPYSPPPVIINPKTGQPVVTKEKPVTRLDTMDGAIGGVTLLFPTYVNVMPPPPSPPLTDREREILARWQKKPLP
jgi:hypothetical protein